MESNRFVMRAGLLFTALWVVSGFKSCQDLRYSVSGRTATGQVIRINEEHTKLGDVTGYTVAYTFVPPGAERMTGKTWISVADRPRFQGGQQLEVEFLDGRYPDSRAKGTTGHWWLIFFVGSSAAMLLCVLVLSIHAAREEKKPRRRTG